MTQPQIADRYAPWDPNREHEPVWSVAQLDEGGKPHQHIIRCTCGEEFHDVEDSVALYADHVFEMGAPDYMVKYWQDWADYLEAPSGTLSRDAVAREMFDYDVVRREVSLAYDELAGVSKPNTAHGHVIELARERDNERCADLILHDLLDQISGEENRQAVIDYANNLSEGAYERHQQHLARLAEINAKHAEKAAN